MLTTTLKQLKEFDACKPGLDTLINSLPNIKETDPIPLSHILQSNGLEHAIWSLRTQEKHYSADFAVQCAEHVLHIFESEFSGEKRPRNAIDAAKKYLKDPSEENRSACKEAALAASAAADDADAALAARAAASAAADAARAAGAAGAARAATEAAGAARAARAARAEIEFQKELFLKIVN